MRNVSHVTFACPFILDDYFHTYTHTLTPLIARRTHEQFQWATVDATSAPNLEKRVLPTRSEQITSLQNDSFDVLIVGGGATGVGCALDAATRGLRTALVESDDFASGTSSRSTKLIHGGVRYLQKAIMQFDRDQYKMVKEALHERATMLNSAPHLAHPLPIMLPVYK